MRISQKQILAGSSGSPFSHPRRDFVANDWEDMTVDDKLDHLLSRLDTLERRLEEVLGHLSDLSDAVEAIELKLRQ
jgi:hypothetical protein